MARPAWDVKQAREAAGKTAVQLARDLSLDDRTILRIERSLITPGSTAIADAIIAALPTLPDRAKFLLRSQIRREDTEGIGSLGLRFPAAAGSYAETPSTALLNIAGDLDVRIKLRPVLWQAATFQTPFGKRDHAATNPVWRLSLSQAARNFDFTWWPSDAGAFIGSVAPIPASYIDGTYGLLRVTVDVDNGAGGSTVAFYTSTDEGTTWTQFSSSVQRQIGIITANSPLFLGGTTGQEFNGDIAWAEVRAGINGPVVARFDGAKTSATAPRLPTTMPVYPQNLYIANEASVEASLPATFDGEGTTGVSSWDATTGYDGTHSVLLTAATPLSGRASFNAHPAGPPVRYFNVTPGQAVTLVAYVKGVAVTRPCTAKINFSSASGVFLTSVGGNQPQNSLGAWTKLLVNTTVPATAFRAQPGMDLRGSVNGDAANYDAFAFYLGTEQDYRPPGDVWTMNGTGWAWVEAA